MCCDLDGVVWRGETPIPGSAEAIARLRAGGRRVVFMTNNSSIPIAGYVERLGNVRDPDRAPTTCARARRPRPRSSRRSCAPVRTVLACAGPGVVEALDATAGCAWSTRGPGRRGGRRLPSRLRLRRPDGRGRRGAGLGAVRRDQPRSDLSDRRRSRSRRRRARGRGRDRGGPGARGRGQARAPDGRSRARALRQRRRRDRRPAVDRRRVRGGVGLAVRARAVGCRRRRRRGGGAGSAAAVRGRRISRASCR